MPQRFRAVYPPEFRNQIIELHRAGRSVRDLAREFEPSIETIASWVRQAVADAGRRPDLPTSAEREELSRLRHENHRLRQERLDLLRSSSLAKAAAWFARDKTPSGSSSS
jgi:transposase